MPGIALEETIGCNNPLLQFSYQVNGILTNVFALSYVIYDMQNEETRVTSTPVTLTACSAGGHRIDTGRYIVALTAAAASDWKIGTHRITWTYTPEDGDTAQIWVQYFEVLHADVATTGRGYRSYVNTSKLDKDDVLTSCRVSISKLQETLITVTELIENWTNRIFEPVYINARYNGVKGAALPLNLPIIGVDNVALISENVDATETSITLTDLLIYNRHLASSLPEPDDRDNPRIEYASVSGSGPYARSLFPIGRQNIRVSGMFGYTEYDGSPSGRRPKLLERVATLMVLQQLTDPLGQDPFISQPGRIRSARTRDQSVTFASAAEGGVGPLTGDRVVDDILMKYKRPPYFGTVPAKGNYL
jgi:hypothetical protein